MNLLDIDTITIDENYDLDIETIEKLVEANKPKIEKVIISKNQSEDFYDYYDTVKLVHDLNKDFNEDEYYNEYFDEEDFITDEPSSTITQDIKDELTNKLCNYSLIKLSKR